MTQNENTENRLVRQVMDAGIVGEGGAGFPAHVKYDTRVNTLIANGCECEPLLYSDQHIMKNNPEKIVRAMQAVRAVTGAKRGIIAIKKKYTRIAQLFNDAVRSTDLELALVDNFYPAGDEQILIHELTGETVPPLGLPKDKGFLVANVGSLYSVSNAMDGIPVTDKVVTVTGDVNTPSVLTVPVGTSIMSCIDQCGGTGIPDPVIILGGPMMGRFVDEQSVLDREVVTKTTGGIIVIPRNHYLHQMSGLSADAMLRRAETACIQCRMCSELCPRYLVGQAFETHRVMRAFVGAEDDPAQTLQSTMCCECGVCELYACPMGLSPRRINILFKRRYGQEKIQYQGPREVNRYQTDFREFRKIPIPRLVMKVDIDRYMSVTPEYNGNYIPGKVKIPLQQHIGAPAVPVVKVGDTVAKNDMLADIPPKSLGAKIHASINGTITQIDTAVTIEGAGYAN